MLKDQLKRKKEWKREVSKTPKGEERQITKCGKDLAKNVVGEEVDEEGNYCASDC